MRPNDYLRVLRRRWLSVVSLTLAALVVAGAATLTATTTYQASTQLIINAPGTSTTADRAAGQTFAQSRVQTYAQVARTPLVLQPVIDQLNLQTTPAELASRVSAVAPTDTILIDITVSDTAPQRAAQTANAIAASLTSAVADLERSNGTESGTVQVTTTTEASVPTSPSSPDVPQNLAVGLVLGLLAGAALALLREHLDTSVRTEADLDGFGIPVLGTLPQVHSDAAPARASLEEPTAPLAESFRHVRTNLQFVTAAIRSKTVVVTSAVAGEGKSTTAINLATSLAASGTRVVLLDADLRRPTVASSLGLEGAVGLTTVLVNSATVDDVLQVVAPDLPLWVLPAGQVPPNPSELLGSDSMEKLLRELEGRADVVVVDSAPVLPVTDSVVLSVLAGGTLLVLSSGITTRPAAHKAIAALRAVDVNVLGLVLNRSAGEALDAYRTYASAGTVDSGVRERKRSSGLMRRVLGRRR